MVTLKLDGHLNLDFITFSCHEMLLFTNFSFTNCISELTGPYKRVGNRKVCSLIYVVGTSGLSYASFSTAKAHAVIGLPLIQEERLLFKVTGSSSLVSSIIRKRDFDKIVKLESHLQELTFEEHWLCQSLLSTTGIASVHPYTSISSLCKPQRRLHPRMDTASLPKPSSGEDSLTPPALVCWGGGGGGWQNHPVVTSVASGARQQFFQPQLFYHYPNFPLAL